MRFLTCVIPLLMASLCRGQLVPTQIQPEEARKYFVWLELSDEQEAVAWSLYNDYAAHWSAQFAPEREAYIKLREQAFHVLSAESGNVESAFREVYKEAARIRISWQAANEVFLGDLIPLLSEAQLKSLPRIHAAVDRKTYRNRTHRIRESNVDIVELILSQSERDRQKTPIPLQAPITRRAIAAVVIDDETYKRIEASVREYEISLVAALKQFAIASDKANLTYYRTSDDRQAMLGVQPDQEEQLRAGQLAQENLVASGRYLLPAGVRIVEVNRTFIKRLCEQLPHEKAAELEAVYAQYAYPQAYPDPSDSMELYERALSLVELTVDVREVIAAMRDEYRKRHALLGAAMADAMYQRGVNSLRLSSVDADVLSEETMFDDVRELGLEREQLNKAQYALVAALFEPEKAALLPQWPFADKNPPRPWSREEFGQRVDKPQG